MIRGVYQSTVLLFGRVLLSMIFIMSGVHKIMDFSGTADMMEAKDLPMAPLLLVGAILCEILGGLSVLLGMYGRLGALLLFVFLIPTTLMFHDFWNVPDEKQQQEMGSFMKNIAIMGGLLMVVGFGTGGFSFERRKK